MAAGGAMKRLIEIRCTLAGPGFICQPRTDGTQAAQLAAAISIMGPPSLCSTERRRCRRRPVTKHPHRCASFICEQYLNVPIINWLMPINRAGRRTASTQPGPGRVGCRYAGAAVFIPISVSPFREGACRVKTTGFLF